MGIFSLPAEPTRCSDSLLWFAPSPWSPLRLTPCSLELATLVSAMLVSATLVPPSLPLPLPPPPTPHPLLSASLPPVSTLRTFPSPATSELSTLVLVTLVLDPLVPPSLPLPLLLLLPLPPPPTPHPLLSASLPPVSM